MRLIDGDKLREYIKIGIDCGGGLEELYNHFDCIPTAYDVDEVINKIEERIDCSTYYINDDDRYNFGMEFAYKDCIGIVRKGAK